MCRLWVGAKLTSQACDERIANHVARSTAVRGNRHRVVGVEYVNVGGLTCLYTEKCRLRDTLSTTDLIIGLTVTGERSWLFTFLKMIANDVGDLAGFRDIFAVLLREIKTFAQKVVGIGVSGLLAKWTGLSLTGRSWPFSKLRFYWRRPLEVNSCSAHNFCIIGCSNFVK